MDVEKWKFLHYDEGVADCYTEASTVSIFEHVSECIDLESIDEDATTSTLYFQSLSVSSLPAVPGSSSDINVSDLVTSLSHVQRPLTQHLDAHKVQSQLDSWIQRS